MNKGKKVWLVTGVSSGLGKQLAQQIHQSGDIIIGTVRKEADKVAFKQAFPNRSHAFMIDLENTERIPSIIEAIQEDYNQIDVLVNNAGYGLWGLVEEVNEEEIRKQLDVNFIAAWKLVRSVLPIMRRQQSGHIIQISSRLGIVAGPGGGLYAAGKFALEGLSEALADEVESFGIKVTLAEPGPLRTKFFGSSVSYAENEIRDYHESVGSVRDKTKDIDGNQPGDPSKVAKEIVRISRLEDPPLRLPLTPGTIDALKQKINSYQQVVSNWEQVAQSVNF